MLDRSEPNIEAKETGFEKKVSFKQQHVPPSPIYEAIYEEPKEVRERSDSFV